MLPTANSNNHKSAPERHEHLDKHHVLLAAGEANNFDIKLPSLGLWAVCG
jgi:hypothetical protein